MMFRRLDIERNGKITIVSVVRVLKELQVDLCAVKLTFSRDFRREHIFDAVC